MRAGLSWARCPVFRDRARECWARGIGALEVTLEHAFAALDPEDEALIDGAEAEGFLLGHGVHFSVLSPAWTAVDAAWLERAGELASRRRFRWVTEHFGCVRAGGVWAAPLPVPLTGDTLARGRDRMARLADAVGVPVGLENLALAWSADDALRQADFVAALLEPVDGLMVLDLHNLWCQAVNFGLDPVELIERQPLDRVRQVHLSGGSWSEWPEGPFRRDTHDGPVPGEVWALLPEAVARCPRLEVVVLERLPPAIEAEPADWRWEVDALATAVTRGASAIPWTPPDREPPSPGDPADALDRVFGQAGRGPESVRRAGGHWLAGADPRSLRTAAALLERWGRPVPR